MRDIEVYRAAVLELHRAASGQSDRAYMSVPARPDHDADLLAMEAVDEVAKLRARVAELERERDGAIERRAFWRRHTEDLARVQAEAAALRSALELLDPRNASMRYELITEAFEKKHHRMAPGKSRAPEMGADPDQEGTQRLWRQFCNGWHEASFDRALASDAGRDVLEALRGARSFAVYVRSGSGDPRLEFAADTILASISDVIGVGE